MRAIGKALEKVAQKGVDDPAAWLLSRVRAYAPTRKGEEPRFTPLPATWFNKERYNDDFTTTSAATVNGHAHGNPIKKYKYGF